MKLVDLDLPEIDMKGRKFGFFNLPDLPSKEELRSMLEGSLKKSYKNLLDVVKEKDFNKPPEEVYFG